MPNLLENSDLPLRLVFRRHCDPSKPALLGEALYDFDGDMVTGLETACQFDLAMYASANLIDDFVLVDQLAASEEILFNLSFVGSDWHMSAYVMTI